MKWILLYALLSGAGNLASGSIEFNTEKACTTAVDEIQDRWKLAVPAFCVAKGDEDPAPAVVSTPKPSAPIQATAPKAKP